MTSDSKEATPKIRKSRSCSPDRKRRKKDDRYEKEKASQRSESHRRKYPRDSKHDKSPETYKRYYGDDTEKKKNSELYWNKYPKTDENVQVGSRYYDLDKPPASPRPEPRRKETPPVPKPRERKPVDMLTSKTGGAYIPPAKLRMMQAEITDKSSVAYQRIAWEALKKSIHGFINKVNTSNIAIIAKELLHENIVRGRGLLSKSIIQAQAASPTFTNVYAALVAIINSKFPNIGELLLKRLVLQFKRGFKQNNKTLCISSVTFVAHLVNQGVAHEILALEILTLLVETPTDDSVEVAISFLKECGQKLTEVSNKGINAIFEMLRNILHEGHLEKRIQYMIEVMFQIRKDGFKDHVAVLEALDLVEEEDQFTHLITLDDVVQANSEETLNVFKLDDKYEENEGKYKTLSKEILGSDSEPGSGSEGSEDGSEEEDDPEGDASTQNQIIDTTETNLITLRRTIYLTIQSSLDFEECAHKLLKMELKPGQEIELCHMFLDCCAEQRTYEKFYGLLAQRFCQINNTYVEPFQQIFKDTYATTHRLDANRLRNVSKFFAHLMFTDAIDWEVLEIMKLNEEDTNSSSRIFIKILFQELSDYMGLEELNQRLKDPTMQEHFSGLFPRDSPKNTRFSINFFTSIGLGGLTAELREHLKNIPKVTQLNLAEEEESEESSSSSSSSSSDTESDSDSSSADKRKKKKSKQRSRHEDSSDDEKLKSRKMKNSESRDKYKKGDSNKDEAKFKDPRQRHSRYESKNYDSKRPSRRSNSRERQSRSYYDRKKENTKDNYREKSHWRKRDRS